MNAAKEDHTMASGNINRIVHDLPFGAQCPTLQQCLWIKQAPGICVLSCFNVVQCIPTEMKGLPKFIIKVIFTVVTNFSLKSFDVYEGIPSLDHLCPSDWFWVPSAVSTNYNEKSFKDWPLLQWVDSPDIILTEEELTREIGHLDAVHVRHLHIFSEGWLENIPKT